MSNAFDRLKRRVLARQRADEIIRRQRPGTDLPAAGGPDKYEKAVSSSDWPEPSDDYKKALGLPVDNTKAEKDRQDQAADAVKQDSGDVGF